MKIKRERRKRQKKEKEEEDAKKKKKPNKAMLAAMAEALAKQKEEEEKLRKEEEEKERAAKKEREKIKKAELKAAGKLLTPAQKAAKARADAMLEAMRAQGVDVPVVGEKRLTLKEKAKRMKQNKSKHVKEEEPKDIPA